MAKVEHVYAVYYDDHSEGDYGKIIGVFRTKLIANKYISACQSLKNINKSAFSVVDMTIDKTLSWEERGLNYVENAKNKNKTSVLNSEETIYEVIYNGYTLGVFRTRAAAETFVKNHSDISSKLSIKENKNRNRTTWIVYAEDNKHGKFPIGYFKTKSEANKFVPTAENDFVKQKLNVTVTVEKG